MPVRVRVKEGEGEGEETVGNAWGVGWHWYATVSLKVVPPHAAEMYGGNI